MTLFLIMAENDGHQQWKTFSRHVTRDKSGQLLFTSRRSSSQSTNGWHSAECFFFLVKDLTVSMLSAGKENGKGELYQLNLLPTNATVIIWSTFSAVEGTNYIAKRNV